MGPASDGDNKVTLKRDEPVASGNGADQPVAGAPTAFEQRQAVKTEGERVNASAGSALPQLSVSTQTIERAVDAFHQASRGGTGIGIDEAKVFQIFQGLKTEGERKQFDTIYRERHGKTYGADWGVERELGYKMSGADLDKALNLFKRTDKNQADDVGRVHAALIERGQWIFGRSSWAIEKDIRDTVSTLNSKQIEDRDNECKQRYGMTMREALLNDKNLSQDTKDALRIYLDGTDKRTTAQTLQLADIALRSKDIDRFREAFRDASPEARAAFTNAGGEARIEKVFGKDSESGRAAADFVSRGEMSTANLIRSNTSWMGDNEKAIEKSLKEMSDTDRQLFNRGRELAAKGSVELLLPDPDKQALRFFNDINKAMRDAGNATEVTSWTALAAYKDSNFVTKLAAHRGSVYNDSTGDVLKTIEGMQQADWDRYKQNPQFARDVDAMLSSFLSGPDLQRARDAVSRRTSSDSFTAGQENGKRPVVDALRDTVGTFSTDRQAFAQALSEMNASEQAQYRDSNSALRKQVDNLVRNNMTSIAERETADAILGRIKNNEKPALTLSDKLNMQGFNWSPDRAQSVRDIQTAFEQDPTLRERIARGMASGTSTEDKILAETFKRAAERVFGTSGMSRYVEPLVQTGHLAIDRQMELNAGVFTNDKKGFYQDILRANPEERDRILNDSAYQQKVLGALYQVERDVALNILRQGEARPEDKLRAAIIGWTTDKTAVQDVFAKMSPGDVATAREAYSKKYGHLDSDIADAVGGSEGADARRALRGISADARSTFNAERDNYYASRGGLGSWLVDKTWDGTGFSSDKAMDAYARQMSDYSRTFRELPVEEQQRRAEALGSALNQFVESKGATAQALVDTTIGVAAIGGAAFTGGVSLGLLGFTVAGGGLFKLSAKAAIMGQDYDSSGAAFDFLSGGVNAGLNLLGPGQIAAALRIGQGAALKASADVMMGPGKELLRQGSEETLQTGLLSMMRNAIINGSDTVDAKLIQQTVASVAKDNTKETVAALTEVVTTSLNTALKAEAISNLQRQAIQYGTNLAAGNLGGGASGFVTELENLDANDLAGSAKRLITSTGLSAGFGTFGAGIGTSATAMMGKIFRAAGKEAAAVPDIQMRAADDVSDGFQHTLAGDSSTIIASDINRHRVEQRLVRVADEDVRFGRTQVERELAQITHTDGTSVLQQIDAFTAPDGTKFSTTQRERLLNTLAEVRENYASYRTPDRLTEPAQTANWLHAQAKITEVLETAKASKLTTEQTEDALLAAALSDAVKGPDNFFKHHIDSAIAADNILRGKLDGTFTEQRLAGILHAIREEQSNPADFMARVYGNHIQTTLEAQGTSLWTALDKAARRQELDYNDMTILDNLGQRINNGRRPSPEQADQLRAELSMKAIGNSSMVLDSDLAALRALTEKIRNPAAHSDTGVPLHLDRTAGGAELSLTAHERELLQITGIQHWYVPDSANPWNSLTQVLRESNARGNYATANGYARMIAARGPDTEMFFRDVHIDDSLRSIKESLEASKVGLSPAAQARMEASDAQAQAAIVRAKGRVEQWLRKQLQVPDGQPTPEVPFWSTTASGEPVQLKYPKRELHLDDQWHAINKIPRGERTPEQQHFWRQHQYDGLTQEQALDYRLAQELRDRMVYELRQEQFEGLPPDIRPIAEMRAAADDASNPDARQNWFQREHRKTREERADTLLSDVDDRPFDLGYRERIEKAFPALTADQLTTGRAAVYAELDKVMASDGKSVLSKLENFTGADGKPMTSLEKDRILSALAEIREHYVNYRNPDLTLDFDQEVNWIHTQGELGRVMDSAKANGLTATETHDAMLASMFSDSFKSKSNFHQHHLDGALAADHVLHRYLRGTFPPERLHNIVQAIREHQISPPGFMAMLYTGPIRGQLEAEGPTLLSALAKKLDGRELDVNENKALLNLRKRYNEGADLSQEQVTALHAELLAKKQAHAKLLLDSDAQTLQSLSDKIQHPLGTPDGHRTAVAFNKSPDGGYEIQLSPSERALLSRMGTEYWYVPKPDTPWYRISQALIDGDSIDNYATAGGYSKIVKIRGPETDVFFQDKHIDDSLKSIVGSREGALTVMSEPGRQLLRDAEQAAGQATERARARVDAWLREEMKIPANEPLPDIPFWTKRQTPGPDGKLIETRSELVYPTRFPEHDADWWRINKIPEANRTVDQQLFWARHRYDGLTPEQVKQLQFAQKIRDRFADELRREQRVDNSLPPDFKPIRQLPRMRSGDTGGEALEPQEIIAYNHQGYLDHGDQGRVFDNGDGTLTKVIHDPELDGKHFKRMHDRLRQHGINVPEVSRVGITEDGQPAFIVQKIGNGDHLQFQLLTRSVPRNDLPEISRQFWEMADRLNAAGLSVDFQLENMTWYQGRLWLLDPSFILEGQTMPEDYLRRMAGNALFPREIGR